MYDYAVVHELVEDLVGEGVKAKVPREVRETVAAVERLTADGSPATVTQAARELKMDTSSASRRIKRAIAGGYLRNEEDRKGHPARVSLGEPLPEDVVILPAPEALAEDLCTVARESDPITPLLPPPLSGSTEAEKEILEL